MNQVTNENYFSDVRFVQFSRCTNDIHNCTEMTVNGCCSAILGIWETRHVNNRIEHVAASVPNELECKCWCLFYPKTQSLQPAQGDEPFQSTSRPQTGTSVCIHVFGQTILCMVLYVSNFKIAAVVRKVYSQSIVGYPASYGPVLHFPAAADCSSLVLGRLSLPT